MKGQLDRDKKIVELVAAVDELYSFVLATDSISQKIELLEDKIRTTIDQTVECILFVREYCGCGFAGK